MKRLALACLLALPAIAGAQVRPGSAAALPVRPDTTRRDTTAKPAIQRDTTRADTNTVVWQAPDSVMRALAERQGYDVTKFQGARVTYDATTKNLRLDATNDQRAAVDRNGQSMGSDSTIFRSSVKRTVSGSRWGCVSRRRRARSSTSCQ